MCQLQKSGGCRICRLGARLSGVATFKAGRETPSPSVATNHCYKWMRASVYRGCRWGPLGGRFWTEGAPPHGSHMETPLHAKINGVIWGCRKVSVKELNDDDESGDLFESQVEFENVDERELLVSEQWVKWLGSFAFHRHHLSEHRTVHLAEPAPIHQNTNYYWT